MKVFVEQFNGKFYDLNSFTAALGFEELGAEVEYFREPLLQGDCPGMSRDTPVVGKIRTVHRALTLLGVPVPEPLDYPEELRGFLCREVTRTTFGEVRTAGFQSFVKPVEHKRFTGQLFVSYYNTETLPDDLQCWTSSPVVFLSEYRCFVLTGELLGVHFYRGDFSHYPDVSAVRCAVQTYTHQPAAFALDVGVLDDGRTALVEVNDGYALGAYGLSPVKYAKMIAARWAEMCSEKAAPPVDTFPKDVVKQQ